MKPAWNHWITGQRVIVVGPSCLILHSDYADVIDSADLVVRVNHGWPVPENLQPRLGSRTDLLYHCCNGDIPIERILLPSMREIKAVGYLRNLDAPQLLSFCRANVIPCLELRREYLELKRMLGSHPSTGLLAIFHLLKHRPRSLEMVGFDFYQEPPYQGYPSRLSDPVLFARSLSQRKYWRHDFTREKQLVDELGFSWTGPITASIQGEKPVSPSQ